MKVIVSESIVKFEVGRLTFHLYMFIVSILALLYDLVWPLIGGVHGEQARLADRTVTHNTTLHVRHVLRLQVKGLGVACWWCRPCAIDDFIHGPDPLSSFGAREHAFELLELILVIARFELPGSARIVE